jgi:hypothetical protein
VRTKVRAMVRARAAQTAHKVEPRGEFYGDRAERDICFARARGR